VSPAPVIFGCAGTELSAQEVEFFARVQPTGLILFARNCVTPDQTRQLIRAFRDTQQSEDRMVLVDQEGGRVSRLKPPHWRSHPPAADFGKLAGVDLDWALEAVRLNTRLIASDLVELGFNVDCLPVLDVLSVGAHDVIGDRAFSDDPVVVGSLGRAACDGLRAGGVLPVIKHIPGHGRAGVDSHESLPRVDASLEELKRIDFPPFKALSNEFLAMTAHVVYKAIDADAPATTSRNVIENIIRGEIGFDGLLMSDDLSMNALDGSIEERTRQSLVAGCDIVLHCNGNFSEMTDIVGALNPMTEASSRRLRTAFRALQAAGPLDINASRERRDVLLSVLG